jgi:hypothetical protein
MALHITMSAIRGEILDMVGVYFVKLIFSHEQFTVVISSTVKKRIKIFVIDGTDAPSMETSSAIYQEVLDYL